MRLITMNYEISFLNQSSFKWRQSDGYEYKGPSFYIHLNKRKDGICMKKLSVDHCNCRSRPFRNLICHNSSAVHFYSNFFVYCLGNPILSTCKQKFPMYGCLSKDSRSLRLQPRTCVFLNIILYICRIHLNAEKEIELVMAVYRYRHLYRYLRRCSVLLLPWMVGGFPLSLLRSFGALITSCKRPQVSNPLALVSIQCRSDGRRKVATRAGRCLDIEITEMRGNRRTNNSDILQAARQVNCGTK